MAGERAAAGAVDDAGLDERDVLQAVERDVVAQAPGGVVAGLEGHDAPRGPDQPRADHGEEADRRAHVVDDAAGRRRRSSSRWTASSVVPTR